MRARERNSHNVKELSSRRVAELAIELTKSNRDGSWRELVATQPEDVPRPPHNLPEKTAGRDEKRT